MTKKILTTIAALFALTVAASAQTTLAAWTFETLTIGAGSSLTNWSGGRSITNVPAEVGTGTASGFHSGFGNSSWGTITGNGSSKALNGAGWTNTPGDYYEFSVSTIGFQNIQFSINANGSSTGPRDFRLQYSTDGTTFTDVSGATYTIPSGVTWTSSTSNSTTAFSFDLSSITAINNQSLIYIRVVDTTSNSISGATVGTSGSSRVDNASIVGSSLITTPSFLSQPASTNAYKGDTITFAALEAGATPLSNQWYYSSSGTVGTYAPLTDGSSGFGAGTISGSSTATLTLRYIDPSQAGYYMVGVSNAFTSGTNVYSTPAQLTVGMRTPITNSIAVLRKLQDTLNWLPTDTTNIYCATGIVTSPFNFTTGTGNTEFFMQDASGCGIAVFSANGNPLPNRGDLVQVKGPLSQFRGLFEFNIDANNPVHSQVTLSTGNTVPSPRIFDFANLTNIAYLETNVEGSIVIVSNVFLQQNSPIFIGNNSINMTNVAGKTLSLFVNSGASDVIAQNTPVFASSIIGHFGQFTTGTPANSGYELDIMQYADLVDGNNTPPQAILNVQTSGTNSVVTWDDVFFTLAVATNVAGPYTDVTNRTPFTIPMTNSTMFFKAHYP